MESKENKCKNFFNDWIVPIVIAVILAFAINKFIVFKIQIPSESMVPTLNINDQLYARRVYRPEKLERGDLVIFNFEPKDELFIKRLIGLPGDEIIIEEGVVTVNGAKLDESYVKNPQVFNGLYTVPEGEYFFLGDNRANSGDSRYWDYPYIKADDIVGEAFIKVYPFSDFGLVK